MNTHIGTVPLSEDHDQRQSVWHQAWNQHGAVHCFEVLDRRFVMDVASGVVTEVLDDIAWNVVQDLKGGLTPRHILSRTPCDVERTKTALADLAELYQTGELFSPDPMLTPAHTRTEISSLCLMLADDCNLRCTYCFAFKGRPGRQRLMSAATARRAVDLLFETSTPGIPKSLSFFGGEPLLNSDVLKATTAYALEHGKKANTDVRINITTNGTLMTSDIRDFIARHPEISLIISMDGGADIHDRHRKFADGTGSHAVVQRRLQALVADTRIAPQRYSVRGTFTQETCQLEQSLEAILDLGIRDVSLEPAITKGDRLEVTAGQLDTIRKAYLELARHLLDCIEQGRQFSFFHFKVAMQRIAFVEPLYHQCSAGCGYLAVATEGALYPCHRLVGHPRYSMGHVNRGVTHYQLRSVFANINVNGKPACGKCWAKYHCGGGCHAHAAQFNGNIYQPYAIECELMKMRLEIAAYLQTVLTENSADPWMPDADQDWKRPEFVVQL